MSTTELSNEFGFSKRQARTIISAIRSEMTSEGLIVPTLRKELVAPKKRVLKRLGIEE